MKNLILLSIVMTTLLIASCKKSGCTDPDAINYSDKAKKDDGTCEYINEQFFGTYQTNENTTSDFCGNGSDSYSMTIIDGGTHNTITIYNFANLFSSINATIIGNTFSVSGITQTSQGGAVWDINSFDGTISGNTITFSYWIDDVLYNYTCGSIDGNGNAVKQ